MRQADNVGAAANFRSVFERCDAPYFMWASDDDLWEPEFVADCMGLLDANPAAQMAFCTIDNINSDDVKIRDYPGFSRFSSTADRMADAERFLAEPDIMGKANLIYGLFRTGALRTVTAECWDAAEFAKWAGDIVFLYAFLSRHPIVACDRVLLHKSIDTPSAVPIRIVDPYARAVRPKEFASYVARHKAVAATPVLAALAEQLLTRRQRNSYWRRIIGAPRRLIGV